MPETSTAIPAELEQNAINLIRGFAMDAPLYAKSGHQGTAMALAPLAHVLYARVMKHDPADAEWPDHDRFVLSNGHASILQYSMLYLCGYGLELDDIKAFRQFESATPGHPEARHTVGVEVTTGPLGQGFGDAVGMAIAERQLRARFGADLIDHHVFVIAGDGCFMEGISHEAASLAGHLGLGRLVCIYDDNHITIDGDTALAYSDDVGKRFEAYGWHVEHLGEIADDLDAIEAGIRRGMAVEDRPSLLILRSHIGHPSPDLTDSHEAHGNPFTPEQVSRTKAVIGMPDEPFWSPASVVEPYRKLMAQRGAEARSQWEGRLAAWSGDRAAWDASWGQTGLAGMDRRAAHVRARREDRHPRRHPAGVRRHEDGDPRPRGRRRRPHGQHRHEARRGDAVGRSSRRPPDLLRCARARHGRGARRHGPPRWRQPCRAARSSRSSTT